MELTVLIERTAPDGFRATSGEPLVGTAEGATRDEALGRLRATLEERVRGGAEVVRLRVDGDRSSPAAPVWPDDDLTRAWLEGIAAARAAADAAADPWEGGGEAAPS